MARSMLDQDMAPYSSRGRHTATHQEDNDDGTSWMDRSRSSWARRSLAPDRVGAGRPRPHRRDAATLEHHRDRAAAGHVDSAVRAGTAAGERADAAADHQRGSEQG